MMPNKKTEKVMIPAPDLKKNQRDDLTDKREIFADVNSGKACNADARGGHEESINESQRVLGA